MNTQVHVKVDQDTCIPPPSCGTDMGALPTCTLSHNLLDRPKMCEPAIPFHPVLRLALFSTTRSSNTITSSLPGVSTEVTNLHWASLLQVPGCGKDLSALKEYHQRYRVCEVHIKLPQVWCCIRQSLSTFTQTPFRGRFIHNSMSGEHNCTPQLDPSLRLNLLPLSLC